MTDKEIDLALRKLGLKGDKQLPGVKQLIKDVDTTARRGEVQKLFLEAKKTETEMLKAAGLQKWPKDAWWFESMFLDRLKEIDECEAENISALKNEILQAVKTYERAMINRFDELCERVRNEPSFGNSTKGKKDNFLDGAESMLTAAQYQRHQIEQALGE